MFHKETNKEYNHYFLSTNYSISMYYILKNHMFHIQLDNLHKRMSYWNINSSHKEQSKRTLEEW